MSNNRVDLIVGTRPNFIKCAVLHRKLKQNNFNVRLIHTGQHYDNNMSDIFFQDLNIPKEDINLNVGSYSHAKQTAYIMEKYEQEILKNKPDITIVFGDVNSTIACVLAAVKLHIMTAHVEAGLRSSDMSMPEEINRLATDSIANLLFAPSEDAVINLIKEGYSRDRVFLVGNIMIDTLLENKYKIDEFDIKEEFGVNQDKYIYLTLHRPANVESKNRLKQIVNFLNTIAKHIIILFPIHPRTEYSLKRHNLFDKLHENIKFIKPISYLKSIKLIKESRSVITDSGGIQEESSFCGIPCFTLRKNTERPITITNGTNTLIEPIIDERLIENILNAQKVKTIIELWDGKTSDRIITVLKKYI